MGQEPDQVRADIERTRAELDRDVEALADKVSPSRVVGRRVDRTREAVTGLKERVMGGASDAAGSVGGTVGGTAGSAGETARSAVQQVQARAEGNPLAAGVIAFGIGWLVSSLLPASPVETRAGGKVREVAGEHGAPVAEEVKAAASTVVEELKEPAREAAQAVKDSAAESGQRVGEEARAQAQDARAQHTS